MPLFRSTLILILLLCAAVVQPLLGGGPIYSRFGLGELIYFGSNRSDAMGGVSIGLTGDGFINRVNPASLTKISLTRFSGSFEYFRISSTDGTSNGQFNRGQFKGLAFAIPISTPHGIVLTGDATPYSTINYATTFVDDAPSVGSTQTFYGSGGLNSFNLGTSYQPMPWLALGAKLNYYLGTTRQLTKVEFTNSTFLNSDIHSSRYLSGFGGTFGLQYSGFGEHFGSPSLSPLTLGIILTTPVRLNVREERIVYYNVFDFDTTNTRKTSADIPLSMGVGMSYTFDGRYVLASELLLQNWDGANFFGTSSVEVRNRARFGIGFEALPAREPTGYWSRVHFRAGFYYHSTYHKVQGQSINEIVGTIGGGFPIGPDARANIGLHYGVRGTTANNLQKDTIFRLTLSLSASEMWFVRIEED